MHPISDDNVYVEDQIYERLWSILGGSHKRPDHLDGGSKCQVWDGRYQVLMIVDFLILRKRNQNKER